MITAFSTWQRIVDNGWWQNDLNNPKVATKRRKEELTNRRATKLSSERLREQTQARLAFNKTQAKWKKCPNCKLNIKSVNHQCLRKVK